MYILQSIHYIFIQLSGLYSIPTRLIEAHLNLDQWTKVGQWMDLGHWTELGQWMDLGHWKELGQWMDLGQWMLQPQLQSIVY